VGTGSVCVAASLSHAMGDFYIANLKFRVVWPVSVYLHTYSYVHSATDADTQGETDRHTGRDRETRRERQRDTQGETETCRRSTYAVSKMARTAEVG
jgi:hypothetical protein